VHPEDEALRYAAQKDARGRGGGDHRRGQSLPRERPFRDPTVVEVTRRTGLRRGPRRHRRRPVGAGSHPFIRALDTVRGEAACIDLDGLGGGGGDLYDLRLSGGGGDLYGLRLGGGGPELTLLDGKDPARGRRAGDLPRRSAAHCVAPARGRRTAAVDADRVDRRRAAPRGRSGGGDAAVSAGSAAGG
jgi:hypothetical protein